MSAPADPRMLTVFDTKEAGVATVPLAKVAEDIRRYEVLGSGDDPARS